MVKAAPAKYFQTDANGILDWTEEKTKKKFSLGDTVKVKIEKIDLDNKRIDMDLVK